MKFHIMDHTGHSTVEFTSEQKAEAQTKFDMLLGEKKIVGTRKAGEQDYRTVKRFEQLEDEAIFTPPRVGG